MIQKKVSLSVPVVGPRSLDVDDSAFFIEAVHDAVFLGQPIRVASRQVAEQLLSLVTIARQDLKENVTEFGFQLGGESLGIFLGLLCEANLPRGAHRAPSTSSSEYVSPRAISRRAWRMLFKSPGVERSSSVSSRLS